MSNNNPIPCTFTHEELTAIKKDVEYILNAVTINDKQRSKRIEILNKIENYLLNENIRI